MQSDSTEHRPERLHLLGIPSVPVVMIPVDRLSALTKEVSEWREAATKSMVDLIQMQEKYETGWVGLVNKVMGKIELLKGRFW
jgi:hypothetical protein